MIKKILTAITLFVCLVSGAQSSKREEGIKIGLKVGLNMSNFSGYAEDKAMRNGLHFGLVSEIILSDKFSFQPELLYSAQGYTNKKAAVFSKERFDYINVPLMIKGYAYKNLSVELGPQVGFLINATSRSVNGNTNIHNQNIVDFGMNLGLGYEIKNGIFFQGRYNYGITNVNGAKNADAFKYTNSVFQISVGVLF